MTTIDMFGKKQNKTNKQKLLNNRLLSPRGLIDDVVYPHILLPFFQDLKNSKVMKNT